VVLHGHINLCLKQQTTFGFKKKKKKKKTNASKFMFDLPHYYILLL